MQTIIMFKGISQYDVLRYFVDDLAKAFSKLEFDVQVIDLIEDSWTEKLISLVKTKEIAFFLGMNGVGIEISADGKSLYDLVGVPFFAFLVDHPMYHLGRLNSSTTSSNIIVSCMDSDHIPFLRTMAPNYSRLFMKVFVPHGASIDQLNLEQGEERPIDVLFAGSFADPNEIRREWKSLYPAMGKLADDIMERAIYDPSMSIHDIVDEVLRGKGISFSDSQLTSFWGIIRSVDLYVRYKVRSDIIRHLNNLPISVEVYGNGWEKLNLKTSQRFKVFESIKFDEVTEKMKQAKTTLNIIPSIRNGGHERIFTSMLSGSVALSTSNPYLQNTFEHGRNSLLFESRNMDELSRVLEGYLGQSDRLQEISKQGQEIARKYHTWDNRATEILNAIEIYKQIELVDKM